MSEATPEAFIQQDFDFNDFVSPDLLCLVVSICPLHFLTLHYSLTVHLLLQQTLLFRVLKGGVDQLLLAVPFAERLQKDVKLDYLSCPSHYSMMAALVGIFFFLRNGIHSMSPHGF
jgi:hypothetical protein